MNVFEKNNKRGIIGKKKPEPFLDPLQFAYIAGRRVEHSPVVDHFTNWCQEAGLHLNTKIKGETCCESSSSYDG